MSFKIGIIGLPNVGKSTLFKALTKKQVDISNYPFCTIKPNIGCVKVPDERLEKLAEILHPEKIIPTIIEFVDIAGLVAGAHKGEGLGNQFLGHIREVDAIAHVVRAFSDPNVSHIHGTTDPQNDIEIINLELCMADLKAVEKRFEEAALKVKSGDAKEIKNKKILEKLKESLNRGELVGKVISDDEEKAVVYDLFLLTAKPMIYVLNVDEGQQSVRCQKIPSLSLKEESKRDSYIALCAKLEAELAELAPQEAKEILQSLGLPESGLDQLIKESYKLLDLITFFTIKSNTVQAWTVKRNTKAPQAAGKIHSDFERGFICAEVINWQDLIKAGSKTRAKEKGLIRTEGKEYVVCDGDVIEFKFQ